VMAVQMSSASVKAAADDFIKYSIEDYNEGIQERVD
jgi:hypothetical protein